MLKRTISAILVAAFVLTQCGISFACPPELQWRALRAMATGEKPKEKIAKAVGDDLTGVTAKDIETPPELTNFLSFLKEQALHFNGVDSDIVLRGLNGLICAPDGQNIIICMEPTLVGKPGIQIIGKHDGPTFYFECTGGKGLEPKSVVVKFNSGRRKFELVSVEPSVSEDASNRAFQILWGLATSEVKAKGSASAIGEAKGTGEIYRVEQVDLGGGSLSVSGAFSSTGVFAAIINRDIAFYTKYPDMQRGLHVLLLPYRDIIAKLGLDNPNKKYFVYHDEEANLSAVMKPRALAISPDNSEMAISDGEVLSRFDLADEMQRLISASTYSERPDGSEISRGIYDLAYLPNGDILFTSIGWCEIGVWKKDGSTSSLKNMPKEAFNFTGPYGVAYDQRRNEVMATNGSCIIIFPYDNPQVTAAEIRPGENESFLYAAYTPDGKYIIATYRTTPGDDSKGWTTGIRIISRETLNPVVDEKTSEKTKYIVKVIPEPSGEGFLLNSAGEDISRYQFVNATAPAAGAVQAKGAGEESSVADTKAIFEKFAQSGEPVNVVRILPGPKDTILRDDLLVSLVAEAGVYLQNLKQTGQGYARYVNVLKAGTKEEVDAWLLENSDIASKITAVAQGVVSQAKGAGLSITLPPDIVEEVTAKVEVLRKTLPVIRIHRSSGEVDYAETWPPAYSPLIPALAYYGADVRELAVNKRVLLIANSQAEAEAKKAEIVALEGTGLVFENIITAASAAEVEAAIADETEGFDFVIRVGPPISYEADLQGIALPEVSMEYDADQYKLRRSLTDATLASSV